MTANHANRPYVLVRTDLFVRGGGAGGEGAARAASRAHRGDARACRSGSRPDAEIQRHGLRRGRKRLDLKPTAWFATPFDSAAADETGSATFFLPGEIKVGAVIGGKPGFATVTVKPPSVARIDIEPMTAPIAVGARVTLARVPRTSSGDP